MSDFFYCVFKLYKGVFRKKQKGNVHFFITPTPNKQLFVFVLVGYSKKLDKWIVSLQWKNQINLIDKVIETLKNEHRDNIEIIDKMNCDVDGNELNFNVNFSEKGNDIKSDLTFNMLPEYSDQETILYSMDGNINLKKVKISEKQIKTTEKSIVAKFKSFFKRLFG